ncbi:S9 family peptidase [Metabacillus sp. JX24]|uniref:S9 family peptidase n=1 Tax=Metabacillus sp. JX24 TaxID=3240759 RepID=UPI00350F6223
MEKRVIAAEDLYKLKSVNDPQMSPCGTKAVYVETSIQEEKHHYISNLFLLDLKTGEKVQWTFGEHRNTSPRWSPDGSRLAFLSNRSGKNQLYVMSARGGEAKALTEEHLAVSQPVWSPDSASILVSLALAPEDTLEKAKEEEKQLEPLVVEDMRYKSDASGFVRNKKRQLAVADAETGELKLIGFREYDCSDASWSPDGKAIAFTSNMTDDPDQNLISDVYILSLDGQDLTKLTNSNGFYGNPSWSPDGRYVAFLGHEKEYLGATFSKIWLSNRETGELSCYSADWDVHISDAAVADFISGSVYPGLIWTEDSQGFYFIVTDQGNTGVYYGSLEGQTVPVRFENEHVYGLSVHVQSHTAVLGISRPDHPSDLYFFDFSTGENKQLTSINETFLNEVELSVPEAIAYKAEDGLEIHGWIMKPAGYAEGVKYPLVLEIHGGPHAMYANTYFHEFQMLAASGKAVLYTNPRGSHGYGQHFVDQVRGDYGGSDYTDLMSAVDYALETYDFIDEDRLGVTGGSYGGFMTNWIVGHTNRFKAAVTQRSISNWISFYGVSDIGYYFTEWELGGNLIDDFEKLWHHSPLKYVKNVETPLLILHGEKDYRCPVEQAEQLYIALKQLKKETKLVRFPEANHELSRSGHPKLRIDRLNHIKEWFDKYL